MTGSWKTEKAKQIYTVDIPSPSQTAHEPSTELTIKKKIECKKLYKIQSSLSSMTSI
jgi:hypothetical protein